MCRWHKDRRFTGRELPEELDQQDLDEDFSAEPGKDAPPRLKRQEADQETAALLRRLKIGPKLVV